MTSATIRLAALGDLERLVSIEIEAARIFPLDILPAHIGRSGSRAETLESITNGLAWVAETEGDGVVGFLAAQVVGASLHIAEMDVLPSHGRQGIGSRLVRTACRYAQEQQLRAVTLTTFLSVPWNAPFYAKQGFRVVSEPPDLAHLKQALEHERARGLQHRVAMVWPGNRDQAQPHEQLLSS